MNRLRQRGRGARDVALAACTGALAAYSQPGIGLSPLMPLALIALAFWAARARSLFCAARIGLSWGIGCFAVITIASREWALIVPVSLTLLGACLYGLPYALWTRAIARHHNGIVAFVATAAYWSLVVELRDALGFPASIEIAAALGGARWLLGGARLFGSSVCCGLAIAGTLGCGVRLAQRAPHDWASVERSLRPLLAALGILLTSCALAHALAPSATRTISVGVPQVSVVSSYLSRRLEYPELDDVFEDLFAQQVQSLAGVDLLALPETFDGAYPLQAPRVRQRFQNLARVQHQAVLLTSYLASPDSGIYNAVGAINAKGELVGVHRKVNLAPFGEVEYEHATTFRPEPVLPGVRVGMLICQEAPLLEGPQALVRAGANLLVSHTSDISFHSGVLVFDHLAMARIRAIEAGRDMVWASAGGPSGAIDRWAVFGSAGPLRAPAAVRMTVALYDDLTPYTRTVWFWRGLAAVALLVSCARMLASQRGAASSLAAAAPTVATRRGAAELLLALTFVWAASVGSAGAVELASGSPKRAKQSIQELLHYTPYYLGAPSLLRFHSDTVHSAAAAAAYFLDFYGQRTLPSAVQLTTSLPTLQDLQRTLERDHGFPTRAEHLDFEAPPRVAAIVKAKSGEFCVMRSDRAHRVWLFSPLRTDVRQLSTAEAEALIEPIGLVPAGDHRLSAD